ncbi:hypothetical protein WN944_005071 [Citrus x changshan-huyou]|uniref:AAA+ ATPase domain-containing protein n=1 Tax=Citrus x changshan-huyou TaxID=2935761 RepID=A0AAP0M2N3_9ROSI
MPSKSKKQSKAPSRLSNSDLSASPRTPSLTSAAWDSEEDFRSSLEDASTRYPTLIGKSAFIGQITGIETDSRGCKIWLSESSMLASSLAPGSLVSVSLPVSGKRFSNGFPLSSLADECVQQFGNESLDQTANQAGSYFALATVFPSCKVLKNEVRLSSSLSYTMGCPLSGRTVFVYTIQSQFLTGLVNGSNKPYNGEANHFSVRTCQELHLELVPLRSRLKMNGAAFSKMKVSAERSRDQLGNGIDSSPKTPMYQPRLSSQSVNQLASPVSEDSVSKSLNWNSLNVDAFDIKEVLEDESAKKLLQTCAASWLYSRSLLCGNLVAVPMLSEISIFLVIGANKLPADLTNERSQPQVTESMDHESNAFVINHETKVYLYPPLNAVSKSLREGTLPNAQIEFQNVQATVEQDISKLGGLSKEYAILKDIIISSSVKSTLSSLGLRPTKGVLLHGPPGTGKTSLARLCAHDSGVNLFTVNGPEVVSQNYGESEQALHEVFDSASQSAPAVVSCLVIFLFQVFIDELDAIAPARKDGGEELSQRMVATLLNLMDGVCRTDGVLVIAATNRPDSIEPALRRPGRLDREIEIGSVRVLFFVIHSFASLTFSGVHSSGSACPVFFLSGVIDSRRSALSLEKWFKCSERHRGCIIFPDMSFLFSLLKNSPAAVPSPAQRLEILHALLSGMEHSLLDSEVEYLSMATHGFVGADLAALCNEAALVCLRRYSKIQTSSDVLHSTGTLFEFEGHSDTMLQDSDCSRNITESSRDCLDSASPCTSDLPTSLLSSSLPLRGTVSEIADNFHNGVSDSSGGMFMSEKGCALKLELVDFEKSRMKVRPSAMREV